MIFNLCFVNFLSGFTKPLYTSFESPDMKLQESKVSLMYHWGFHIHLIENATLRNMNIAPVREELLLLSIEMSLIFWAFRMDALLCTSKFYQGRRQGSMIIG